ncbi:dodecin [Marinobacterium arenosum]|uniref:dodecin n=1 Tax=Marinobacterium arenosum TaxID=2862496 RepID=UPI001C943C01|nr:dodecin [Marinobacterium arenosum]MBY4675216.1 dodecin family protein [Marinobacterium arenosum]
MADHIYKKVEVVGTSTVSIDDAIQKGIARAADTINHVEWFEVSEIRGHVAGGKVDHFQVVMKVGFRLD